jgi:hypothetical protein
MVSGYLFSVVQVAGIDDAGIQKAADRYDRNQTDFS